MLDSIKYNRRLLLDAAGSQTGYCSALKLGQQYPADFINQEMEYVL